MGRNKRGRAQQHAEEMDDVDVAEERMSATDMAFFIRNGGHSSKKMQKISLEEQNIADAKRVARAEKKKIQPKVKGQEKNKGETIAEKAKASLIVDLKAEFEEARKTKNFERSDELRNQLEQLGYVANGQGAITTKA